MKDLRVKYQPNKQTSFDFGRIFTRAIATAIITPNEKYGGEGVGLNN